MNDTYDRIPDLHLDSQISVEPMLELRQPNQRSLIKNKICIYSKLSAQKRKKVIVEYSASEHLKS